MIRNPTGRQTPCSISWITGGGTGIGFALAKRLYQAGAKVMITGRRPQVLEAAVREILVKPSSGEIESIAGDSKDPVHVQNVLRQVRQRWGEINLLINNAGVNHQRAVLETDIEDYQEAFETNCLTAVRATRAVLPAMQERGVGAIINISSIYGKWASAHSAAYSVSKYALAGFTDALRQGLVGTPIHVMGVYPGYIRTDMTRPYVQDGTLRSRLGKDPDQLAIAILKALRRRKTELLYPWYVPWALRLPRWLPKKADWIASRIKR